jgi:hypothetical protein
MSRAVVGCPVTGRLVAFTATVGAGGVGGFGFGATAFTVVVVGLTVVDVVGFTVVEKLT